MRYLSPTYSNYTNVVNTHDTLKSKGLYLWGGKKAGIKNIGKNYYHSNLYGINTVDFSMAAAWQKWTLNDLLIS